MTNPPCAPEHHPTQSQPSFCCRRTQRFSLTRLCHCWFLAKLLWWFFWKFSNLWQEFVWQLILYNTPVILNGKDISCTTSHFCWNSLWEAPVKGFKSILSSVNGSLIILDKTVIEIGIELLDCWQSFGLKHITVDGAVDILGSSAIPIFKLRKQFINKDWSFLRDETMSLDSSPKHHSWRKLVFFISQFVTNLVFFTAIDNIGATYFLLRQIINGKWYKRTETTYENIESN